MESSLCNSFEDWAPVEIYECPILRLDCMRGYHDSSSSNGHQGDMQYCFIEYIYIKQITIYSNFSTKHTSINFILHKNLVIYIEGFLVGHYHNIPRINNLIVKQINQQKHWKSHLLYRSFL